MFFFIETFPKRTETETQHIVESTGVLNNHQTYFLIFSSKHGQTDRQTGAPDEVPPVLKNKRAV